MSINLMTLKELSQANQDWSENSIDVDAIIAEYPNLKTLSFVHGREDSIIDRGNCYTLYMRNPQPGAPWLMQDIMGWQISKLK